ncbi:uncharacterized protein LOC111009669 [Momordica charantia]|uniref:Uncharacterized protein LOC111009669 n=1 Tax=Momordica charantia TaxID=3673 RepID=A0A6J1CAC6_MOMCH|nr:uncharacterized protein LOC111009669 [Momordica charantia]
MIRAHTTFPQLQISVRAVWRQSTRCKNCERWRMAPAAARLSPSSVRRRRLNRRGRRNFSMMLSSSSAGGSMFILTFKFVLVQVKDIFVVDDLGNGVIPAQALNNARRPYVRCNWRAILFLKRCSWSCT